MFGNMLKQHRRQVKLHGHLKELRDRRRKEPNNLNLQVRIGDLLTKIGRTQEAVLLYRWTAERFAEKNYFSKAMALNKIIMRLDPSAGNHGLSRKSHEEYGEAEEKKCLTLEEVSDCP
jgi:hypothetical protein